MADLSVDAELAAYDEEEIEVRGGLTPWAVGARATAWAPLSGGEYTGSGSWQVSSISFWRSG